MIRGMVSQIFIGCFAGLVSNYELHMLLRYLAAVSCAQLYTAGQVICKNVLSFLNILWLSTYNQNFTVTDITGNKYRTTSICFFECFWSIGIILLPAIAYIDPNWSSIFLMISLPTLLYIPIWWLIPDTPRWFLSKGRIDEAVRIVEYAITVNNTKHRLSAPEIRQHLTKHVGFISKEEAPAKWHSLWNDRRDVIQIIAVHIAWAVFVTNYNGMLLNVKAFGREYLSVNTISLGEYNMELWLISHELFNSITLFSYPIASLNKAKSELKLEIASSLLHHAHFDQISSKIQTQSKLVQLSEFTLIYRCKFSGKKFMNLQLRMCGARLVHYILLLVSAR